VDLVLPDWENRCDARGCSYLNPAAFVRVPVSPITNATLRPGNYQLDMARGPSALNTSATLSKSFALAAGRRLQIRADVFNVLNRKNYQPPELRINNVDFGRITSATPTGATTGARTFQFGGRLTF
jgi:hypothetical protein